MKPTKHRPIIDLSPTNFRSVVLGGLALLSYSALPMTARAQDSDPSDPAPEVVHAPLSTEGKSLLAATVFVAAALVGMERFCSWRLSIRQRQASGLQPTLAECLPPTVGLAARFSPTPES